MTATEWLLTTLGVARLSLPAAEGAEDTWQTGFGFNKMSHTYVSDLFLGVAPEGVCSGALLLPEMTYSLTRAAIRLWHELQVPRTTLSEMSPEKAYDCLPEQEFWQIYQFVWDYPTLGTLALSFRQLSIFNFCNFFESRQQKAHRNGDRARLTPCPRRFFFSSRSGARSCRRCWCSPAPPCSRR